MLRFSLLSMIRRARPGLTRIGRRIKLRVITPTNVLTGDLGRIYTRVSGFWWEGARDRLLPAYGAALNIAAPRTTTTLTMDETTPGPGVLQEVMEALRLEADRLVVDLTADLREWAVRVERWHRKQWTASLQPNGVSLNTVLSSGDVGDTVETFLQQNVSLVRNVSDATRRRIEQIVFNGFTQRSPAREIARELVDAIGLERQRALRIASDQTVKLASQLDTERMVQAGIEQWEWVHSGKLHFRPQHKARNGNIYTWDNAPEDLPGMLPYCGCKKRAVLDLGVTT